jgi:Cu2+-exporting ATPase
VIAFAHGENRVTLAVRQALRPDATAAIEALRCTGYDIRILSGDRKGAVTPIASALGVIDWQAGVKPPDKISAIESLRAAGHRVLMVGDGLNDAPALAAANASLSPVSAVDLAQAHSDAVFLGERLQPVVGALMLARRARRLMLQNLSLAVIYNAIAVPIAVAGLVTPLIAAVAMSGSSLLVTLNALRARLPATNDKTIASTLQASEQIA